LKFTAKRIRAEATQKHRAKARCFLLGIETQAAFGRFARFSRLRIADSSVRRTHAASVPTPHTPTPIPLPLSVLDSTAANEATKADGMPCMPTATRMRAEQASCRSRGRKRPCSGSIQTGQCRVHPLQALTPANRRATPNENAGLVFARHRLADYQS
jgi:hypothetical protein